MLFERLSLHSHFLIIFIILYLILIEISNHLVLFINLIILLYYQFLH